MYKVLSVLSVLMLVATSAMATATPLIDYSAIAGDLTTLLQTAIGAAIGVGVLVLGAKFGWRFFKSFAR